MRSLGSRLKKKKQKNNYIEILKTKQNCTEVLSATRVVRYRLIADFQSVILI